MIPSSAPVKAYSTPASRSALETVIARIREDSWNGSGPGEYVLPSVRSLHISEAGGYSLPTLYANARAVAYLHGYAPEEAAAVREYLRDVGSSDVKIEGHYGNTTFYIDRIAVAD
ncbi:MAG: hypothetical protein HY319_22805 [Armatimonadetes bacterium]|nr:hypothetical protein [Armatimonadota bacterium]